MTRSWAPTSRAPRCPDSRPWVRARGVAGRAPAGGEDGFATVVVLALAAVLVLLAAVLTATGAVAVARHRAAAAADLAALAGAAQALSGAPAACAAARAVLAAQGASVGSCLLAGDVLEVEARITPAGPVGRFGTARARARAGPTSAGG